MQAPPFSALFTFWLSTMAAVGLASRSPCPDTPHKARDGCDPACRRSSTSRDSQKVCCAAAFGIARCRGGHLEVGGLASVCGAVLSAERLAEWMTLTCPTGPPGYPGCADCLSSTAPRR